ncbi:5-aminolevulinate synthase [Anaplasmataceae bacterium AB001_6]|nr:5-aminolevulinate synthase [Anaplasmataceae bacterium AB001_6]
MVIKEGYDCLFSDSIADVVKENRYREFINLERMVGRFPVAFNKNNNSEVVVWCSNDYLGMVDNPVVIESMKNALDSFGSGSGGTRNISGNHSSIVRLESLLADLHKTEAALVFTSGYIANLAAISSVIDRLSDPIVLSDECNHASIIRGIKSSKNVSKLHVYRNNDMLHLEEILKNYPKDRHKIIICESVYSMSGAICPLEKICDLSETYNAILYVDEVHSVGLYGDKGAGIISQKGLCDRIDILQANLGKSFGLLGGYIASSSTVVDYIRSFASEFIFTTSIPPVIAEGAISSIKYVMSSSMERECVMSNVQDLKNILKYNCIKFLRNNSHMIILPIGDPIICKRIHSILLNKYNIYVQCINYPTVKKGGELLRITPGPKHTEKMMRDLVEALRMAFMESGFSSCISSNDKYFV